MRDERIAIRASAQQSGTLRHRGVLSDIAAGAGLAVRDSWLRADLAGAAFAGVANGFFIVGVVPWIDRILELPTEYLGLMISIVGASGIVVSIAIARIGDRVSPERIVLISVIAGTAGSLGFVWPVGMAIIVPCLILFGVSNVGSNIGSATINQRRFASDLQGRVSSLQAMVFQGAHLVGIIGARMLADSASAQLPMTVFGGSLIATCGCVGIGLLALRDESNTGLRAPFTDLSKSARPSI